MILFVASLPHQSNPATNVPLDIRLVVRYYKNKAGKGLFMLDKEDIILITLVVLYIGITVGVRL
jgi:hypothetical protein